MARLILVASLLSLGQAAYCGTWFCGDGGGDADEWLAILDTARAQLAPNDTLQDITFLYNQVWNGLVEGPTWGAWWTQNSYGTTLGALPYAEEPLRSFIRNANWMWFEWIGNGTRVGLDDPNPAPDGCLCDAAEPSGAYYKQGDGNVPIHDWALEETLSAIVMQAEQVLQERDPTAFALYLPLFNRTLNLIESRRNATLNLFYSGDASNLLAPSYGAWLLPNGSRVPAFLTGMSVSYIAALDRVIEIETLAGGPWTQQAVLHTARRDAALEGLPALLAPSGDYFIKWMDPNGTLHGVLGAPQHAYIEAVVNHDAVALGVAERVRPGLSEAIMTRLLGDSVPKNPVTGGPGLRPYALVITNAAGLDDMEYPDTSWLWQYGTWVNGGEWATCEARMMLAYARTGRHYYSLDSMRALLGFASIFRMDSPLVAWGSAVYQPNEPINIVVDMFAIPAALLRGLWDPVFTAAALTLTPHVPGNITNCSMLFPLLWGPHRIYVSSLGNASTGGITAVRVNGAPWPAQYFTGTNITLPWALMPATPSNLTVEMDFAGGVRSTAAIAPVRAAPSPLQHPATRATAVRALKAIMPTDTLLWLQADALAQQLPDGARVATWPDASGAPGSTSAAQSNASAQPVMRHAAMNGLPAVHFDGASTFLRGNVTLPSQFSVAAVFQDAGESNVCCTGIFYSSPGCGGVGTKANGDGTTVMMIDWSGSDDSGADDITRRQVVAAVVYNASGAFSFADGCVQSAERGVSVPPSDAFMVGSRNDEMGRFFNGNVSEVIVFAHALNDSERDAVQAYLSAKWPRAGKPLSCTPAPPNCTLPQALQAIVKQMTAFVAGMRAGGFADARYELAHALLVLQRVAAWEARCAGLNAGTIAMLPSVASEAAADAMYVVAPQGIAAGLATVLTAYAGSADPTLAKIYDIWQASNSLTSQQLP